MNIPQRLHPYVPIKAGFDTDDGPTREIVRGLLRDKALDQASRLVSILEDRRREERGGLRPPTGSGGLGWPTLADLPALDSLDRVTDGLGSRRIVNMLRAFNELLAPDSDYFGDDQSTRALFDPRLIEQEGGWLVTSPALLAIQAILYGHAEWFRPAHHDAYSALHGYGVLCQLRNPPMEEADRRFVAALIAHQTLLRAAWPLLPVQLPDPQGSKKLLAREAMVFVDDLAPALVDPHLVRSTTQDEQVARALARTLFPFLPGVAPEPRLRAQLADALVLTALCLQCRHLRRLDQRLRKPKTRAAILRFTDLLASAADSPPPPEADPSLVFCQFGHHVMQWQCRDAAGLRKWEAFEAELRGRAKSLRAAAREKMAGALNLTVCFDRHAPRLGETLSQPKLFVFGKSLAGAQEAQARETATLIERTVGWTFDVETRWQALLGQPEPLLERWRSDPSGFFAAFARVRAELDPPDLRLVPPAELVADHPLQQGYLAVPLVGHVLRILNHLYPEGFSLLRLRPRRLPSAAAEEPLIERPFTIHLPRLSAMPKPGDPARIVSELIARYVAAMVINLEVCLGPQIVELDYFSQPQRALWHERIEEALEKNGHAGILAYVEQYHAEICTARAADEIDAVTVDATLPRGYAALNGKILGIDVGATAVKWALFEIKSITTDAGCRLDVAPRALVQKEIPTRKPKEPHKDAKDFAARVLKSVGEAIPSQLAGWEELRAVGVAWPGAVHDRRSVAARSGILQHFKQFGDWQKAPADQLHLLDVRGAFEAAIPGQPAGAETPCVILLNDGDADIKATELSDKGGGETISVVLKAGTGTAGGVFIGGRQLDLLAEVGKMVLNLRPDELPDQPIKPRLWPAGVLNPFCSAQTLPAIAKVLGWRSAEGTPEIDAREIGYFLESDSRKRKKLRERIGQQLVYDRYSDLFDAPIDVAKRSGQEALVLFDLPSNPKDLAAIARRRLGQLKQAARAAGSRAATLAKECADVAGRQLGDAIALLVAVFRCREIHLGGGAFSGATGEKLRAAACQRLRDVYRFEVQSHPSSAEVDAHALADVQVIQVLAQTGGPTDKPPSGPFGAARAAVESLVRTRKGKDLQRVRSEVEKLFHSRPVGGAPRAIEPEKLCQDTSLRAEEVERMLEIFMASLGLTRTPEGELQMLERR